MRIGCLQFAPQVGDIDNNLNRADAVLSKANPKDLDLLVLPEMAFSGYNFRSLQHISPFLEPTTSGISSLWARTTALKYNCVVTVGYPEKVDVTPKWPTSPEYYNSAIVVNGDGETIANYRKSFLYYTDETWALEGPDGFYDGEIDGLGNVAMGICKWPTKSFERMDLNPYKFEAPWSAWEFSYHVLHKQANLVILSMAWLTREDARAFSRTPKDPDMDTLSYWLARLEPLIRAETEGEMIVVMANRTGTEEEAVYAGTSAVLGIQQGEVKVYGILGRGEKELLIVDTEKRPQAKLVSVPNTAQTDVSDAPTEDSTISRASDASAKSGLTVDTDCTSPNPNVLSPTDTSSADNIFSPTDVFSPSDIFSPTDQILDVPMTMADVVTPISPCDPITPNTYFNSKTSKRDAQTTTTPLRSSIPEPDFTPPVPSSPTFNRPPSPKSRNASRTRELGEPLLTLLEPDFTPPAPSSPTFNELPFPKSRNASRTRQPEEQPSNISERPEQVFTPPIPSSPTFNRPTSPKSRNASRTRQPQEQAPALISHDLAMQEQISQGAFGVKSPPHSASVVPDRYQSSFTCSTFGSRSQYIRPRPKSAVW